MSSMGVNSGVFGDPQVIGGILGGNVGPPQMRDSLAAMCKILLFLVKSCNHLKAL